MAWPIVGMAAAGALSGYLGSKEKKAGPFDPESAWWMSQRGRSLAGNAVQSPTFQMRMWNRLFGGKGKGAGLQGIWDQRYGDYLSSIGRGAPQGGVPGGPGWGQQQPGFLGSGSPQGFDWQQWMDQYGGGGGGPLR